MQILVAVMIWLTLGLIGHCVTVAVLNKMAIAVPHRYSRIPLGFNIRRNVATGPSSFVFGIASLLVLRHEMRSVSSTRCQIGR